MPFVNVKIVKGQVSSEQKKQLIEGLTDLIVEIMGRERRLTVIAVDELEPSNWAIGGKALEEKSINEGVVSFINIKVSKGTTNPEEMSRMLKAAKELMTDVLRNNHETNYFIIDELNSEGWGFDGLSMAERGRIGI